MSSSNSSARKKVSAETGFDSKEFPDIIDNKINTEQFLEAAHGVVLIVDKLGKSFTSVRHDIQGNIDKLTKRYLMDKTANSTLQDMILLEKATEKKNRIAIDALMWLRRGLHLALLFMEKIVETHKTGQATDDLSALLKEAYKEALEPYHGWMLRQLFNILIRTTPSRSQFLLSLAEGEVGKEEINLRTLEMLLVNLRKNVINLKAFYIDQNLEVNTTI